MNTPRTVGTERFRRVSCYSAAAVSGVAATLSGFEVTQAALLITPASVSLSDDPGLPPLESFDLNDDGTPEIGLLIVSANLVSAQGVNGASLAGDVGPGGFFYPTAFSIGQSVGSALTFSGNSANLPHSFGTLAHSFGAGAGVGNWMGGQDGYLGAKFSVGGNDHFGWIHVVWDPDADTATIDFVAFESLAGAAATVIPEPSSLTLLALGAAGLARRRRRAETRS